MSMNFFRTGTQERRQNRRVWSPMIDDQLVARVRKQNCG